MSSVQFINSKAEILKKFQALAMNINAAKSLQEVMKSNLGPKGTLKMLVGGAGQIKLTKDGCVLLHEMQIQHPTASLIARSATAQDDTVGDGTTSNVLFIGALLKEAERLIGEGVHARVITEGYEKARIHCLEILQGMLEKPTVDSALLRQVAKTSMMTKLHPKLANMLVDIVVDAIEIIRRPEQPIDLFMVEIMHMQNKMANDSKLVRGLVLDHGGRHPDMPKKIKDCYVLNANVSLEYEKTEVNSTMAFSNAEQREKIQASERRFTDERCQKIIDLKEKVCAGNDKNFVLINQKGIDPICLDMLARHGILALRRAKRRNGERLALACGGRCVNAVDDLTEEDLGFAGEVSEFSLGDEKYTFVEDCKNPLSCTILVRGQNDHTIAMLKDAVRDGLRSVKNTIEDDGVLPGAGAFEIACYDSLKEFQKTVEGKAKLGVEAFADALMVIPKTLASNSGYEPQDTAIMLLDEYRKLKVPVGLDVLNYGVIQPSKAGIFDSYSVKRSFLNIAPTLAQQLLLVDEILKAGKKMGNKQEPQAPM